MKSQVSPEKDAAQWGKKRPGNYFDEYADWCGDRTPHPRHGWRGFAGGHNTESLWCLGTAMPASNVVTRPGETA